MPLEVCASVGTRVVPQWLAAGIINHPALPLFGKIKSTVGRTSLFHERRGV